MGGKKTRAWKQSAIIAPWRSLRKNKQKIKKQDAGTSLYETGNCILTIFEVSRLKVCIILSFANLFDKLATRADLLPFGEAGRGYFLPITIAPLALAVSSKKSPDCDTWTPFDDNTFQLLKGSFSFVLPPFSATIFTCVITPFCFWADTR